MPLLLNWQKRRIQVPVWCRFESDQGYVAYTDKENQRAYGRQHYLDNKELYLSRSSENRKIQIEDRRRRVREYLLTHPCVDCGEADPIVLDFDHVDHTLKTANISKMVRDRARWSRIEEEIAKCEVRCANCHRRRTAKQFGWG